MHKIFATLIFIFKNKKLAAVTSIGTERQALVIVLET